MCDNHIHDDMDRRHVLRRMCTRLGHVLLVFVFAVLPGCRDYTISTVIHPDGSCDRTITYTSNLKQIPEGGYRLPADTSWHVTWKEPEKKGGDYTYQATRHFSTLKELSTACAQEADSNHFAVTVTAESHFRWFYTYVSYRETYGVFNPFTLVPASKYLTDDEIRRFSDGDTARQLKDKVDAWEEAGKFEELYQGIAEAGDRSGDSALARSIHEAGKGELLTSVKGAIAESEKPNRQKKIDEKNPAELLNRVADVILDSLSQSLGNSSAGKLRPTVVAVINTVWRKDENLRLVDGNFTNTVTLPGIVLTTNASDLKASTLTWHYTAKQLRIREYQLLAESRVVNLWAIVSTGAVALGLILTVVLSSLRSRR